MFKKIFKTDKKQDSDYKNIMIAALLIHAAKMDENYTDIERRIISRALSDFTHLPKNKIDEIIKFYHVTIVCKSHRFHRNSYI